MSSSSSSAVISIRSEDPLSNPIDLLEQIMIDRDWGFDRPSDEEIYADAPGQWGNHHLWCTWDMDQGILTFSASIEGKLPRAFRQKFYQLLAMVNEKLWLGHFDVSSEDGTVSFRHAVLLREGNTVSAEQLEALIETGVRECERFFPAYQSLVWSGKSPEEALRVAIFDTVGEA